MGAVLSKREDGVSLGPRKREQEREREREREREGDTRETRERHEREREREREGGEDVALTGPEGRVPEERVEAPLTAVDRECARDH